MKDFSVLADIRGELPSHKTRTGISSSISPQVYPIPQQQGGRIPQPYPTPRFLNPWSPTGRNIARVPSVQGASITPGNERTLSPSRVNIMHDVSIRGSTELNAQQRRFIQSSPSRKARRDSLRDMPFMGLKLYAQTAMKRNLAMLIRRLR